MRQDPALEWQRLTEYYRSLQDEELREVAADMADLTETAQQTLRDEMKRRGVKEESAPPAVSQYVAAAAHGEPSGLGSRFL